MMRISRVSDRQGTKILVTGTMMLLIASVAVIKNLSMQRKLDDAQAEIRWRDRCIQEHQWWRIRSVNRIEALRQEIETLKSEDKEEKL